MKLSLRNGMSNVLDGMKAIALLVQRERAIRTPLDFSAIEVSLSPITSYQPGSQADHHLGSRGMLLGRRRGYSCPSQILTEASTGSAGIHARAR